MRHVAIFLIGGIVGAIVGALWIGPERVGVLSDDDSAAIEAAATSLAEAAVAMDWAAFAGYYAEDALWVAPDGEKIEGRSAIEDALSGTQVVDFGTTTQSIEGCGELAYRLGTYTVKYPVPGWEEPGADTARFVEVWKRQPRGSWLLLVDIWDVAGD